ncbi:MAG: aminodeoxychorismate/anthranilate synthase component II [Candidatus Altiarchaeales archaeon]|nr:aminodeoxychorismate/anthranilate synthase component II [Candidatus Altiarchaeales archaeon]
MKTLVIDNIDSFVYNLVQYAGIQRANPYVVENNLSEDEVDVFAEKATHILISPGPGRPEAAGISNYVIEKYGKIKPTLGVCLGHQCIAQVYGAEITYAPRLMHGKESTIEHFGSLLFKGIPKKFKGARYHSLIVSEANFPEKLKITAQTRDQEIMAIEHAEYPLYGLQFHPESILTQTGMKIMKNFFEIK